MATVIIALDAMGSDRAPEPELAGALAAAARAEATADPLRILLVGDRARLEPRLRGQAGADRITVVHADPAQVVTMEDHPAQVVRRKRDSSLARAMELVRTGEAAGVVSAGNSGAVLGFAMLGLGRSPGIERPAVMTVLPTPSGPLVLADAGANVDPRPRALAQFGVMAAAYARVACGVAAPRLGLLSNGAEAHKGTELTRACHALLVAAAARAGGDLRYAGPVEGSDLFRGVVDAVATDGFTGNVVLKTCEGIAEGLFGLVRHELEQTARARVGAALVAPALRRLARRIDYSETGGALLAGVGGVVVLAHGRSDRSAISNAVAAAARFAAAGVPAALAAALVSVPD